jgi:phosphatidylglycerophosphate synthase
MVGIPIQQDLGIDLELFRKVPKDLENPIDNIILKFVEKVNPVFRYFNFTPNILTTISLFFGILMIYCIYISNFLLAGIFIWIYYVFDCFDGNFARRYNMTSEFGYNYDKYKDQIIVLMMILIFLANKKIKFYPKIKILFICLVFIFLPLSILNENCNRQDTCIANNNINILKNSRFFGWGTTVFMCSTLFFYIHTKVRPK